MKRSKNFILFTPMLTKKELEQSFSPDDDDLFTGAAWEKKEEWKPKVGRKIDFLTSSEDETKSLPTSGKVGGDKAAGTKKEKVQAKQEPVAKSDKSNSVKEGSDKLSSFFEDLSDTDIFPPASKTQTVAKSASTKSTETVTSKNGEKNASINAGSKAVHAEATVAKNASMETTQTVSAPSEQAAQNSTTTNLSRELAKEIKSNNRSRKLPQAETESKENEIAFKPEVLSELIKELSNDSSIDESFGPVIAGTGSSSKEVMLTKARTKKIKDDVKSELSAEMEASMEAILEAKFERMHRKQAMEDQDKERKIREEVKKEMSEEMSRKMTSEIEQMQKEQALKEQKRKSKEKLQSKIISEMSKQIEQMHHEQALKEQKEKKSRKEFQTKIIAEMQRKYEEDLQEQIKQALNEKKARKLARSKAKEEKAEKEAKDKFREMAFEILSKEKTESGLCKELLGLFMNTSGYENLLDKFAIARKDKMTERVVEKVDKPAKETEKPKQTILHTAELKAPKPVEKVSRGVERPAQAVRQAPLSAPKPDEGPYRGAQKPSVPGPRSKEQEKHTSSPDGMVKPKRSPFDSPPPKLTTPEPVETATQETQDQSTATSSNQPKESTEVQGNSPLPPTDQSPAKRITLKEAIAIARERRKNNPNAGDGSLFKITEHNPIKKPISRLNNPAQKTGAFGANPGAKQSPQNSSVTSSSSLSQKPTAATGNSPLPRTLGYAQPPRTNTPKPSGPPNQRAMNPIGTPNNGPSTLMPRSPPGSMPQRNVTGSPYRPPMSQPIRNSPTPSYEVNASSTSQPKREFVEDKPLTKEQNDEVDRNFHKFDPYGIKEQEQQKQSSLSMSIYNFFMGKKSTPPPTPSLPLRPRPAPGTLPKFPPKMKPMHERHIDWSPYPNRPKSGPSQVPTLAQIRKSREEKLRKNGFFDKQDKEDKQDKQDK